MTLPFHLLTARTPKTGRAQQNPSGFRGLRARKGAPPKLSPLLRKGAFSTVAFLAILLVVALVLIYSVSLYSQSLSKYGDIEGCRLSILLASNTKNPVTGSQLTTINCPRRSITLTKNDAIRSGAYAQDKLMRTLAEEMRTCWYMFGEGARPFGNSDILGTVNHCIICSEIKLDPDLVRTMQAANVNSITGFEDYFSTTAMGPGKYGNPDLTYSHYIDDPKADTAGLKALAWTSPVPTSWYAYSPAEPDSKDTVIPLENLVVLEVYKRRGTFTEDYYTLDLVPASKMPSLQCEKLWN